MYKAEVTETDLENKQTTEHYVGLCSTTLKERLDDHIQSFKHEKYSNETSLSTHIWKIKSRWSSYTIKWKIIDRGRPFNPTTKTCSLCIKEKFFIIISPA